MNFNNEQEQEKEQLIYDNKNLKNTGVILLDEEIINDIRLSSGKLADSCEYQVGFWSVNIRAIDDNCNILDICIPTAFYNYKQEVVSGHIDFKLTDVEEISKAAEPIHEQVSITIEKNLIEDITNILKGNGFQHFEVETVDFNTIHKHPGAMKVFSTTDLQKLASKPGVVYPLAKAEDKPNFAGIMIHEGLRNTVARFEYRLANGEIKLTDGKPGDKESSYTGRIDYQKGRCISIVRAEQDIPSLTESIFGFQPVDMDYSLFNEVDPSAVKNTNFYKSIKKVWEDSHVEQNTLMVMEDNITKKVYKNTSNKTKGSNILKGTKADENKLFDLIFKSGICEEKINDSSRIGLLHILVLCEIALGNLKDTESDIKKFKESKKMLTDDKLRTMTNSRFYVADSCVQRILDNE